MKNIVIGYIVSLLLFLGSCTKFIDIVPDNVPVIDQAFNLRVMAQRYLANCYNRLPSAANLGGDRLLIADEFWLNSPSNYGSGTYPGWYIAMGQQNVNNPLLNYWEGNYWQAINDCNVFIARIFEVPDMTMDEKQTWAAEAKVLKAYYHFLLLRAYGPIIIRDNNFDVYDVPSEMHEPRRPVDECFAYIVATIDDAMPNLMVTDLGGNVDIGHINQIIARAIKAQVLIETASPLFNGNTDMANFLDDGGRPLFNPTYDPTKWTIAAEACREAIALAAENGKRLHRWSRPASVTVQNPTAQFQMNARTAFSESDQNPEGIWYDTRNVASGTFQANFTPHGFNANSSLMTSRMGATRNMAEKFYSRNGVPIEQDKNYPYNNRYDVVAVPNSEAYRFDFQIGYNTARMHLDREPRFYGVLSFDGGRFFMQYDNNDANSVVTNYKIGGNTQLANTRVGQTMGYTVKKYTNYQNSYGANNVYNARLYAIPRIRLADLYLLYAEALNESQGPSPLVYAYVDSIRARAGLQGVVQSWANHSTQPNLPQTQEGLRQIIKRERTIELSFEGVRYWDLRRWKDAIEELNVVITGWDMGSDNVAGFYRTVPFFNRTFLTRDYFWPISINELRRNPRLKQNPGW